MEKLLQDPVDGLLQQQLSLTLIIQHFQAKHYTYTLMIPQSRVIHPAWNLNSRLILKFHMCRTEVYSPLVRAHQHWERLLVKQMGNAPLSNLEPRPTSRLLLLPQVEPSLKWRHTLAKSNTSSWSKRTSTF